MLSTSYSLLHHSWPSSESDTTGPWGPSGKAYGGSRGPSPLASHLTCPKFRKILWNSPSHQKRDSMALVIKFSGVLSRRSECLTRHAACVNVVSLRSVELDLGKSRDLIVARFGTCLSGRSLLESFNERSRNVATSRPSSSSRFSPSSVLVAISAETPNEVLSRAPSMFGARQ